ncbi:hypothetical protein NQ314_008945 [Rhamnusium bicolor]|uniref:Gustatory receptor n=1 Tax=Rhamnusium bicolor TaxID=1586634 RepID=A0AAV8Y456_9CUCU|nr:hypothetical protein NQ314_008945 [Rhamnusium bicolor]
MVTHCLTYLSGQAATVNDPTLVQVVYLINNELSNKISVIRFCFAFQVRRMYNLNLSHMSVMDDALAEAPRKRSVYLEGAQPFYQNPSQNPITKVAPAPSGYQSGPVKAFQNTQELDSVLYDTLKPILTFLRIVGIYPIGNTGRIFQVTPQWMIYSVAIFVIILGYIGYIKWDKVEMVRSAEGRFEEAVIDYLFTVYLVPIILNPIAWYEARKQAAVLTNIVAFEKLYNRISKKQITVFLGNKPLVITIGLPFLSVATMVVTHITMVRFRFLQQKNRSVATSIALEFQQALKNIGPSTRVAEYRSLWMMLSKIIRDVGNAFGYTVTFLCLYLFLIITLTIYGLMSQIQEGLGIKDIGLAITAGFATALLFFICDEAHYASNCVRVQFQKKLLLINMFLRATEMNPTDMSLGGFFDVNRNLFKSVSTYYLIFS